MQHGHGLSGRFGAWQGAAPLVVEVILAIMRYRAATIKLGGGYAAILARQSAGTGDASVSRFVPMSKDAPLKR